MMVEDRAGRVSNSVNTCVKPGVWLARPIVATAAACNACGPVFYVITRWLAGIMSRRRLPAQSAPEPAE